MPFLILHLEDREVKFLPRAAWTKAELHCSQQGSNARVTTAQGDVTPEAEQGDKKFT